MDRKNVKKWSMVMVVGALAAVAVLFALDAALPATEGGAFKVIVNTTNPQTSLLRAGISGLFLKKITVWTNGREVVPVDLVDGSPVRDEFSKVIHQRSVTAVKTYWRQQIFDGRSEPPIELRSEAEVVAFVKDNADAIGYVGLDCPTDDVKVLDVIY